VREVARQLLALEHAQFDKSPLLAIFDPLDH
jgi:hypothetical protein